jgi:hypothetical protein
MSGERNVAAEWQRLMKLWDSARIAYDAAQRSTTYGPDHGATGSTDGALDQAYRRLTEIKEQIDRVISACSRTRAASTEPLRLTLLDLPTNRVGKRTSPKVSRSAQAFPRYSKR